MLKWITTAGNLQRWRGDTAGGKTKKALATEIADQIKKAGITGWTYKGVLQKVNDLQDSYNKAADLKRQSGEGIRDEDEEKTFHDKLVTICKYWDTLEPFFHDRASSKPIAPTGTFNAAKPFCIAPRSVEDDLLDGNRSDYEFPFGEDGEQKSDGDGDDRSIEAGRTRDAGNDRLVDPLPDSTTEPASTDPASEESTAVAPASVTASRNSSVPTGPSAAGNGKKTEKSKRSKPLSLKSTPHKKRKSLDDVMYDSICERTSIAKQRSCIEMAQAKIHEGLAGVGDLLN
ncbi:hypothetical protein L914_00401 [Phytophthora nicotianae]|uniref:Myb/SANT-like domain-containing protein n=2 Tax=Phytophthora nicotianae TaxID=4792 RepID=V9EKB0_PHYNI|nr:hypothetical protein F443_15017 [Phytophthora nicotianae P1569]ETM56666.1 hypothetical protein L914_00401 [Phytophthora nicotianae]